MKNALVGFAQPIARWLARHPKATLFLVIVYVICPVDLLPEALFGPFGYLDDFFVILIPLFLREYGRELNQQSPSSSSAPTPDVVETTAEKTPPDNPRR